MADKSRNDTFKQSKNPLLTGAALDYAFENFSNSALLVPQPLKEQTPSPLPSDGEVDSFLGQDVQQRPAPFSSILNQPNTQQSTRTASSISPTPGNVAPTSFLQNQINNYFSPLISTPICTPIVTTYSSSAQSNTVTNAPQNYASGASQFSSTFLPPSASSVPSGLSQNNNFQSSSIGAPPLPTAAVSPHSIFQPISAPPTGFASVFQPPSSQPVESSSFPHPPPFGSTSSIGSASSIFQSASPTVGASSIFQPVSASPASSSPLQSLHLKGNENFIQSTGTAPINTSHQPQSTQVLPPSYYSSDVNPSASLPSLQNPLSNFAVSSTNQPVSSNPPQSSPLVTPIPTYSPNLFQPGNVITPPLFSATVPSEGSILAPGALPPASLASGAPLPSSLAAGAPLPSSLAVGAPPPLSFAAGAPPPASLASGVPPPTSVLPPKAGGLSNTYRLGNLKRPAYAPPPDLGVSATNIMPAIQNPVVPAPSPASLFTPVRDETDNHNGISNNAEFTSSGTSTSSNLLTSSSHQLTDFGSNPTLPTYQSPVSNQATPAVVLSPSEPPSLPQGQMYRPPYHHWFYKKQIEGKVIWHPFSMADSLKLEEAFTSLDISPDTKVPTDGGRYDVDVLRRRRISVYWQEEPGEVRRCSWFVKGSLDSRYTPYEEKIATLLEEEYKIASTSSEWNRQVPLADGEVIILHSANAIAHHLRSSSPDAWGNSPQMQQKPRVVKRGLDEFDIPEGEPETIDHILFLVHGIGKFCDLKFRPVTEVVDDFRSISLQLLQSHFRGASEVGTVNRVEVLPVSWHTALHTEEIDQKLRNITLSSIHRLRQFTNDTLLDILFYTSPVFCETIVQAVGNELNRLFKLFKTRNPQFNGGVSLGGHSLGSLILFDMLCNQRPASPRSETLLNNGITKNDTNDIPNNLVSLEQEENPSSETNDDLSAKDESNKPEKAEAAYVNCMSQQSLNRTLSYVAFGNGGTGKPYISYPQLVFHPKAFFALGSPIGMFVTVRGIDALGEDFHFPTCPAFYNIFHPFDPVAYRVETLISPDLINVQPVLIPHHKGRKRMHLELKDTMAHVGAAIKQRFMESIQSTWNTVYQLAMFHKTEDIGQEVNKVLEDQMIRQQSTEHESENGSHIHDGTEDANLELRVGTLNGGRRIDYVLQEAPLESFNEYLFALSSHVCYWESEDTMLMMLKEIYASMGIAPDNQVPQQILPFDTNDGKIDGVSNTTDAYNQPHYVPLMPSNHQIGMDPTAPPSDNIAVGPPPTCGFRRN